MLLQNFKIDETKINNLLNELNEDRNNLFNECSKDYDKIKEEKLKTLESIQRSLLKYKKILANEKNKDN